MRISDWSSDVCSSDLHAATILALMKEPDEAMAREGDGDIWRRMVDAALRARWDLDAALHGPAEAPPGGTDEEGDMPINAGDMQKKDPASWLDRKSVVYGKSVSVRVDLGGRRIIKKK